MTVARLLLAAMAFLLLVSLLSLVASAAVTLDYLRGLPETSDILIEWQTATELDTAGFYIMRWNDSTGRYEEYSEFMPAQGFGTTGATYDWRDQQVTDGVTYYYKLEELARNQARETYGPVTVTMGLMTATPSPTPSPTPTQTPTPTPSPEIRTTRTLPSLTDTPTPTPSTTQEAQGTFTPTATASPATSPTPTATGSLVSTSLPTNTPQSSQAVSTTTPVPPGMVAITTATAAAFSTSLANATATRSDVIVSPISTAGARSTLLPGQTPVEPNATHSAVRASVVPLLSPVPTEISKAYPSASTGGQPGPSGGADATIGGTNWVSVGLAMGMFAVAAILIAGAIVIIRSLLR